MKTRRTYAFITFALISLIYSGCGTDAGNPGGKLTSNVKLANQTTLTSAVAKSSAIDLSEIPTNSRIGTRVQFEKYYYIVMITICYYYILL